MCHCRNTYLPIPEDVHLECYQVVANPDVAPSLLLVALDAAFFQYEVGNCELYQSHLMSTTQSPAPFGIYSFHRPWHCLCRAAGVQKATSGTASGMLRPHAHMCRL